jgi:UDP-2,3-diacylglucosamine hydrolase
MSGTVFFISDLHLDEARPAVIAAFEQFLAERRDAAALYILGDLFEYWIGDDDDAPLVDRVARALHAFSDAGPKLYLMHGNRDFLMGERFATRVGATLLKDPSVVEEQHQKILLMHGDSLCTRDEDYQTFREVARSAEWQEEVLAKPLEERRELAKQLRRVSLDAGSRKADDIMDVTEREVMAAMEQAHCTTLVHGHTHRPARHEHRAGVRWVLGDWDKRGWYLSLDEAGFKLQDFQIN